MPDSAIHFTPCEVSAFYAARAPRVKQGRGPKWRGPCPLHGGKNPNLSVDPRTGCWYCFSQCGRGGGVIDFEMALTGAGFHDSRRAVFDIIGRPDSDGWLSRSELRQRAITAEKERRAVELSELWRTMELRAVDESLERATRLLWVADEASLEQIGADVRSWTKRKRSLQGASGDALTALFRDAMRADPLRTKRLVMDGARDKADAEQWAVAIVRLLEASTRKLGLSE